MIPILRFLFIHSKQGENFYQLQKVALELVKARRESGKKVFSTIYAEIFARRKFSPISPSALYWRNFYCVNFLSCVYVNDYIEDMATFTALAKIYSTEYFCNTKVAGLGEIFVQRKFCHIWVLLYNIIPCAYIYGSSKICCSL